MTTLKRPADCYRENESNDSSDTPKSPESEDSCESSKRRKIDLEERIFKLGYDGTKEDVEKLSKRQKKKLIKRLEWNIRRPIKRKIERQKRKLRLVEMKVNGIKIKSRKMKKLCLMKTSNCKVKVVIDLSFDDLMSEKDIQKCMQQVNRCYCANRSVENPLQFYVTQLTGMSKQMMEKHDGYRKWDVHFHEESYLELFDKENLVYLTSDSDNVIDELDDNKAYIIGGLVDHNSYKNVCHRIACDQGIQHGRLPLDKYLDMKTRKVLTINHVFEIMLYVANGMSWKDAFVKVLPLRKGAQPKTSGDNDDDDEDDDNDDIVENNNDDTEKTDKEKV